MNSYLDFSSYSSYQRLLLVIISFYSLFLFISAYRIIFKDRNKILDNLDRLIFLMSLIQIFLLTIYFVWSISFFLISIRFFRFYQELFICSTFLYAVYDQINVKYITYLIISFSIIMILFWFLVIVLNEFQFDYDCGTMFFFIISGITLILSSLNVFFGYNTFEKLNYSIFTIKNNELMTNETKNSNIEDINAKKIQLLYLMSVGFISICIQFFWDYSLHFKENGNICMNYYHGENFINLIFYGILKFITLFLPVLNVYYVFYWKNQKFFNTAKELNERNLNIFYDDRSEYLEELERENNDEKL